MECADLSALYPVARPREQSEGRKRSFIGAETCHAELCVIRELIILDQANLELLQPKTQASCSPWYGKYAFVALTATWSLIHEAELAFLFERTATGWKMILRQDTVRL